MGTLEMMQQQFEGVQNKLKDQIECRDTFALDDIRTIAGVDLAYRKEQEKELAVCCIVIIDRKTHTLLETQQYWVEVTVPYMPGFLAFRELPLCLKQSKN